MIKTYSPPNNCIPSKANININKKSRNRRLSILLIAFNKDNTKLRNDAQYLNYQDREKNEGKETL